MQADTHTSRISAGEAFEANLKEFAQEKRGVSYISHFGKKVEDY